MWPARRRQLLIHEQIQRRKWPTKALNSCTQIRKGEEGEEIRTVTAQLITWEGQDGRQYQAFGVYRNLEEGPDPFQFTLEGWPNQE
jgi:hypothetical protein